MMSSHWSIFPVTKEGLEDRFVDVTERQDIKYNSDKSGIGKKAEFQAKVDGETALSSPVITMCLEQVLIFFMPLERQQCLVQILLT